MLSHLSIYLPVLLSLFLSLHADGLFRNDKSVHIQKYRALIQIKMENNNTLFFVKATLSMLGIL